jgi:hypothetical protein
MDTNFLSQPGTSHEGMRVHIPVEETVRRLIELGRRTNTPVSVNAVVRWTPVRTHDICQRLKRSIARPMSARAAMVRCLA